VDELVDPTDSKVHQVVPNPLVFPRAPPHLASVSPECHTGTVYESFIPVMQLTEYHLPMGIVGDAKHLKLGPDWGRDAADVLAQGVSVYQPSNIQNPTTPPGSPVHCAAAPWTMGVG